MSVQLNELAGVTRKLAHSFQAFDFVLKALNEINDLEQAVKNAQSATRTAIEDGKRDLVEFQEDAERRRLAAEGVAKDAEAEAARATEALDVAVADLDEFKTEASEKIAALKAEIAAGETKLAAVKADMAKIAKSMAG